MEKIICEQTNTENGTSTGNKVKYFIAPTVREMVEKINELVEAYNELCLSNKKP